MLNGNATNNFTLQPISDLMITACNFIENQSQNHPGLSGFSTGFFSLDDITDGFQKGSLITINQYDFRRKEFPLQLMFNFVDKTKIRTGFFTFESTSFQTAMEFLRIKTQIPLEKIRLGRLDFPEATLIQNTAAELYQAPFFAGECLEMSNDEFFRELKKQIFLNKLEVVFIDSLNSIPLESGIGTKKDKQLEVLKKLKTLAKEMNIVIVTEYFLDDHEKEKTLKQKTQFQKQFCDVQILLYRSSLNFSLDSEEDYTLEVDCKDIAYNGRFFLAFDKGTRLFKDHVYS